MNTRWLPIVARELRVAARRRGTYRSRFVVALLVLVVFLWVMLVLLPQTGVATAQYGVVLFRSLIVVAMIYGGIGGAVATADIVSREKREGTLGLLFLTDLRGYDVALGKLTASSVNVLYALLTVIPVLTLSIQLGGVTSREIGLATVVLLNSLFLSVALGLLVSTLSLNDRKAMFATLFVEFFLIAWPYLFLNFFGERLVAVGPGAEELVLQVLSWSPVYPVIHLVLSSAGLPFLQDRFLWYSLLQTHLLGWIALLLACRWLPRVWQVRESRTLLERMRVWVTAIRFGRGERRARFRRRLLAVNPMLWLLHRERWKPLYAWVYFGAVGSVWIIGNGLYDDLLIDAKSAVPGLLLMQAFLKVWVVSESATRLAEERSGGSFELLLTTPLSDRDIIGGHWKALGRQFGKPLLLFVALVAYTLHQLLGAWQAALGVGVLLADLVAVAWAGMWFGLTTRSPNRAILRTTALVLMVPWLLVSLASFVLGYWHRLTGVVPAATFQTYFLFWCVAGLGVDAWVGRWARGRMLGRLRQVASEGTGRGRERE